MKIFSIYYYLICFCVAAASIDDQKQIIWSSHDNTLFMNNESVSIKGINYFGFDTDMKVPHGLNFHDLDFYFRFLSDHRFNSIRLPFSYNVAKDIHQKIDPTFVNRLPTKCNKDVSSVLDCFFQKALEYNISIVLDLHKIDGIITETPYGSLSEKEFYHAWDNILDKTVHYPNLIGIDIKNEPHGKTTWKEWGPVVNRFIHHIQEKFVSYKGVFFVEGVENDSCWGSSFQDMENHIEFPNQKIVFSPHIYGISVIGDKAKFYDEEDFHRWFGFLQDNHDNTIIIGEIGGFYQGSDKLWHEKMGGYLKKINQTSVYYWCLNPDSQDTRGILKDDWTTADDDKLSFLKHLQPDPTPLYFSV